MALPTDNIRGWDDIADNYKDDILSVSSGNTGVYYTSASTTVLSTGYNFCDIDLDGDNGDLADVLEMLKHLDTEDQDINPASSNWDHFLEVLSYYDPESTPGTLSKTTNNGPCMSLRRIRDEFNSGATGSVSFSDFYRGGSYVTDNNTGVPTSGTVDFNDFYGAAKLFSHTITSNQQEIDLSTYLTAQGWDGTAPVVVTIDTGVYIWSDDNTVGGLTIPSSMNGLVTLTNKGYIIGRGGDGGGQNGSATNGGPALVNNATGVTLTNVSGAFIAGGGGGGGGGGSPVAGGGGGAGGGTGGNGAYFGTQLGGSGGAVGQVGQNSQGSGKDSTAATGGGAGGGGGAATTWFDGGSGGGAGGGRILGTGATGGSGGVANSGGGNQNGGAGGANGNASVNAAAGEGGGGWGAAGYNGGSGGAAISGTAIATYTNNGTVYGSVA